MFKLGRNNLQSICRTCLDCLKSKDESVPASSVSYNIWETPNLTKLLMLCTTMNINEDTDEAYPQQVCLKCYNSLQEIQRFRDMALQSNEMLRKIVEDGAELTANQNNAEHEHAEPTKVECADSIDNEWPNNHFEASQPVLSSPFINTQNKEPEFDEFLDINREIKIESTLFDNESYENPANSVAVKVMNCSTETLEPASTSKAAAKRKRSADDGAVEPIQCAVESCKMLFKSQSSLHMHTRIVHAIEYKHEENSTALEQMKSDIADIKNSFAYQRVLLDKLMTKLFPKHDHLQILPFKSLDDVKNADIFLTSHPREELISYVQSIVGNTPVRKVMHFLFEDEALLSINWDGRQRKFPIKSLKFFTEILYFAVNGPKMSLAVFEKEMKEGFRCFKNKFYRNVTKNRNIQAELEMQQ